MFKRTLPIFAIFLALAAGAAHAQFGGGGMGGGHRGGGRRSQAPEEPPPSDAPAAPRAPQTPTDRADIVGVIRAIDPANDRVTISYDAVDALNWPAGTTPFVVAKHSLLQGATVGEKVRFRIESQQISSLQPYAPPTPGDSGAATP